MTTGCLISHPGRRQTPRVFSPGKQRKTPTFLFLLRNRNLFDPRVFSAFIGSKKPERCPLTRDEYIAYGAAHCKGRDQWTPIIHWQKRSKI